MSEKCNQNCNSCQESCADRKEDKPDFTANPHELSNIKKVIGVVSGKGGVGKSLVTSMLAVTMNRLGYHTAILDADLTGPSIPRVFGIKGKASGSDIGLYPIKSEMGIDIMSINLLLDNDTDPVLWRGPLIAGTVKQFWTDVIWGDIDYMFIDMPPGTGDVPLTVFQSIKVDGIIIVTSPQELVSMIVTKAVKMAKMMDVPIIGLVENMSYFTCPDNDKDYKIFGNSHIDEIAVEHDLSILARIPIDPRFARACDRGLIELIDGLKLDLVAKTLINMEDESMRKIAVACDADMVTEHFGECDKFIIYETMENDIVKSESIANPGHRPGFLPNYLNDLGVNVIIAGVMGERAFNIFAANDIEVIIGASGAAETAVQSYLAGNLKTNNALCHEHHNHEQCGH